MDAIGEAYHEIAHDIGDLLVQLRQLSVFHRLFDLIAVVDDAIDAAAGERSNFTGGLPMPQSMTILEMELIGLVVLIVTQALGGNFGRCRSARSGRIAPDLPRTHVTRT